MVDTQVYIRILSFKQDGSRDGSVGVSSDPSKDKKYFEEAMDTLRVQKNEVTDKWILLYIYLVYYVLLQELQRYIKDCERKEKQRELRNTKTTPTN